MALKNSMRSVHPGEVLREDYLELLDMRAKEIKRSVVPTAA